MAKKIAATKAMKKSVKKAAGSGRGASARRAVKKPAARRRGGNASLPKVRVQMFRQGLGDSFLITFNHGSLNEQRMFIDCGTLGNSFNDTNAKAIAQHMQSLVAAGQRIQVLVATHEHQDHLSGFRKEMRQALTGNVDHVWLAWTENPADPDAQKLAKTEHDLGAALQLAVETASRQPVCRNVADLLGFAGDITLGADFAETVNEAMHYVRTGTGVSAEYLEPGAVITADWLPGFRVFVLGPPRQDEFLKNAGSHDSDELFHAAAVLQGTAAAHQQSSAGGNTDANRPFDDHYCQSGRDTLATQYDNYLDWDDDWRRIDYDWLNSATDLALQLDKLTNNTSLVLAIERIADGKVLLFAADAQEGNWLSWHELKFQVPGVDGAAPQTVTAAEMLARTVFYKVGHHGSHNATAKAKGLELMTQQDELVAFIPVDRKIALGRNPKGDWQMPFRPLYLDLLQRCQGRVVRTDMGWAARPHAGDLIEEEFIDMADAAQWTQWAQNQSAATHIKADPDNDHLCFEYILN